MKLPLPSFRLVGIAATVALCAGTVAGWKLGASHWRHKYDALLAQGWEQKAASETIARHFVEEQLATYQATTARNQDILHDYQDKLDSSNALRDHYRALAKRLFDEQARLIAASTAVPEAPSVTGATEAGPQGEDGSIGEAVAEAFSECHRNTDQLDALIAQVLPQL